MIEEIVNLKREWQQDEAAIILTNGQIILCSKEEAALKIRQLSLLQLKTLFRQQHTGWNLPLTYPTHVYQQIKKGISEQQGEYELGIVTPSTDRLPLAIQVYTAEAQFLFALKAKSVLEVSVDTELYYYPTPNVYSSGKICWGTVNTKELTPGQVWQSFVSSEFTEMLNPVYQQRDLQEMSAIGTQKGFPTDRVKPANLRLADLAEEELEGN